VERAACVSNGNLGAIEPLAADVLVVGTDDWGVSSAASELRDAGRRVHRCYESTEAPFPCNALVPGKGCPLDVERDDVVLTIRVRPRGEPSLSEMGAICGLRAGLPLVAAGLSDSTGVAPWAVKVPTGGDVVSTCDQAVADHEGTNGPPRPS
jgi:hypothetical protein